MHRARSMKTCLAEFGLGFKWKKTLLNTFVMNLNKNCEPGLLIQHQGLTSQILYQTKKQKIPQKQSKTFPEEWKLLTNSILICVFIMRCHWCPNTVVHTVYLILCSTFLCSTLKKNRFEITRECINYVIIWIYVLKSLPLFFEALFHGAPRVLSDSPYHVCHVVDTGLFLSWKLIL